MPNKYSSETKELDFKPVVLTQQVSKAIRDAILEGIFKGGQKLVESKLQAQFGISRFPVRVT